MKRICAILAVLLSVAPMVGCGSLSTDRCEQSCDCRDCGSREYDECILSADYDDDYYGAYGCDVEYQDYADCEIDKARCVGDNYFIDPGDCVGEITRLNDCVKDSSSLD